MICSAPRRTLAALPGALVALALAACSDPEASESPPDASRRVDLALPDLAPLPGASVLHYHNDPGHRGVYVDAALTHAAAARLRRDPTFVVRTAGPTFAQPLLLDGGPGGRDLLFVATEQNQVSALDARSGAVVWQRTLGPPVPLSRFVCGNIDPLGITGTPVIDFPGRTLYLETMTSPDGGASKLRLLHALGVDDGGERAGWPVDVAAAMKRLGLAFDPQFHNQRGALNLLGDSVYVPYGGMSGDCGGYRGAVVGVRKDDPSRVTAWQTRGGAGGVWSPGGVVSDGTWLYVATGNTGGVTTWSDGEAVIRLGPGPRYSAMPDDYFSPASWLALDQADSDLGGTAPVLLDVPGATPARLVLALGKNGRGYLLDRDHLGGVGGERSQRAAAGSVIIGGAVTFTTPRGVYVAYRGAVGCSSGYDLIVDRVVAGSPPTLTRAWCAPLGQMGSPIVTTSDGTSDFIVWALDAEAKNGLHGYDADTGAVLFDGGGAGDKLTAIARFMSPIVAKGRIYVAGASEVAAFAPR